LHTLAGRSIEQAETQDRSYQVKQTCLQASPHGQRSAQAGICWQTHGAGRHTGLADTRAWQTHVPVRHTGQADTWAGRHTGLADTRAGKHSAEADMLNFYIRNISSTQRFTDR